jgi:predicted LPLAT superfamily acyltransferase
MEFRPCLVIPNFNHGYALGSIIHAVEPLQIDTIIVNDASTDSTAETLNNLASAYRWISPIHRSENGGKGAAIRDGLLAASERGYTHAVCIDGDGQHATSDIPRFLATAQRYPEHLILGAPQFGADAPPIRRIGREVSNIAVAASTWSLSARDVLCGFRVYPLAPICSKIELMTIEPRMGFDVEIVARAIWAGIAVQNLPTSVSYPKEGVSHFKYGRDNCTLFSLEIRLICEGLWRSPARLARSLSQPSLQAPWHQLSERGSEPGLHMLLVVLELLGQRALVVIMTPIITYFYLCGRSARRAAVDFQERLAHEASRKTSRMSAHRAAFMQFWSFGISIVDKVTSWRHGLPLERFTWKGREEVKARLANGQGVILMGAHVGNLEVIRALGDTRNVTIHALMYTAHSRHFKRFFEKISARSSLRVYDLTSVDPALIFALQEAIARGEVVALLADRVPKLSSSRSVPVPFLGDIALFPEGPWILSSMLQAPVFSVFSMRGSDGLYHVEFELLAERISLPRSQRQQALREYASRFASRLSETIKRYPWQWYNFYDFWGSRS